MRLKAISALSQLFTRQSDHRNRRHDRVHRHGIDSIIGKHRADVVHHTMDALLVAGPWLLAGGVAFFAARSLIRSGRVET